MRNSRFIRTGNALTLSAVQQYCPAAFATEPHHTRGPRYEYIPTIEPLERLLADGWGVYQAQQNKARLADREGFCRHSLHLRRLDHERNKYGGAADGTLELQITNAHDGTAAYTLNAAYYRLVCSNSMTTGKRIAAHRVVHAKGRSTGEIIDVVARIVEDDFPRMQRQIELFQNSILTHEQSYELAAAALDLRYPGPWKPFAADKLLHARREVDAGLTAWAVLNRIQENVMQGGWEERSVWSGRRTAVRPIEAIAPAQRINTGLWTRCEELVSPE